MAQQETGHAKNIAVFGHLIQDCKGLGDEVYRPANAAYSLAALKTHHASCVNALAGSDEAARQARAISKERDTRFSTAKKLAGRVVKSFRSSGAAPDKHEALVGVYRKLTGRRAPGEAPPTAKPAPATRSVSQLSFDNMEANFGRLVAACKAEPKYNPAEEDLTVAALEETRAGLTAANAAVSPAESARTTLLAARDALLYADGTGLIDIAKGVKNYVFSLDSAAHPGVKQNFSRHRFRKVKSGK